MVEDQVEVAVQVNGKTRGKVTVAREADQETVVAAALGDPAVRRFSEGREVRKVVYVANRLLNLVVDKARRLARIKLRVLLDLAAADLARKSSWRLVDG